MLHQEVALFQCFLVRWQNHHKFMSMNRAMNARDTEAVQSPLNIVVRKNRTKPAVSDQASKHMKLD
jgi:hypothetical protein